MTEDEKDQFLDTMRLIVEFADDLVASTGYPLEEKVYWVNLLGYRVEVRITPTWTGEG